MKRTTIIILILNSFMILAQPNQKVISDELINSSKTSFGLVLGGNFSNVHAEDNDTLFSQNFNSKLGGHVGVKMNYSINSIVQFQTGLFYDVKGYRESSIVLNGISITTTYHTFYISVPATIQFNYSPKEATWGLFGRTGLFYGIATQGFTRNKSNSSSTLPPTVTNRDLRFGDGLNDDQKRTELGYILGGGFTFEAFEFGILYEQSFNSIASNNNNGLRITNNVLKVSFTYFLKN